MKKICLSSFVNSIITATYITGVAFIMFNGDKIFGKIDSVVSVIAFLTLFVLSALVVGGLLLAKPIMNYIDNKKKEAVYMLIASAGWMLLFFIIAMVIMLIAK